MLNSDPAIGGGTEQEEALRDAGLRRGRLRWPGLPGTGSRGALIVVLVAVIGSNYLLASRSRVRGEASPIEQLEAEDAAR